MGEVKYISDRLSFKEGENEITVVILASSSKAKLNFFTIWLSLFAISGLLISVQIFVPGYGGYQRIGIFAFTTFYIYFIYKLGYVWLWRMKGIEFIRIAEDCLTMKRAIGTYGKTYSFFVANIKNFGLRKINQKAFSWELENSYWVVGGEKLSFDYNGKETRFGLQLNDDEIKKLYSLIHKWLKKKKYEEAT